MKKNVIAIFVLFALSALAWFMFRQAPGQKEQSAQKAIAPVDISAVDGLKIVRREKKQGALKENPLVLKKQGSDWTIIEPVKYPAHKELVDLMLGELSSLHVIDDISENKKKHRPLEVDDEFGIEVTAYSGDKILLDLIIGASNKNMTFVRLPGSDVVYRTVGAYRHRFNKPADSFRDKSVVEVDKDSIVRVKYMGEKGELEMVRKGEGQEAAFSPVGVEIEHFDNRKATGNANALALLTAKGFVDAPLSDEITGFEKNAARLEIDAKKDGALKTLTVWIGNDDKKTRQTYVKTSVSEQVYLVSTHLIERFRVGPSDFAMTDEELDQRAKADQAAKEHEELHHH